MTARSYQYNNTKEEEEEEEGNTNAKDPSSPPLLYQTIRTTTTTSEHDRKKSIRSNSYYHDDDNNDDDYYDGDDNDKNGKDMSRLATLQSVDTMWEDDNDIDDNDNDENVVLATSALKESQEVTMPATLEPDLREIASRYTSHATTTDSYNNNTTQEKGVKQKTKKIEKQ